MIWVFGDCTRRFSEIYEEILKSARKDCLTLAGELWYSFGGEFFIFGFDGDRSYVCICGECRKLMMRKGIEKGRTMEDVYKRQYLRRAKLAGNYSKREWQTDKVISMTS